MTSFIIELRSAIVGNQEIKLDPQTDDDNIKINESKSIILNNEKTFNLDDKSGFKSNDDSEYDIRAVYFGWLNKDVSVTDYITKCEDNSIKVISFLERTDLISYLKGDINTCSYLVNVDENELSKGDEPTATATTETATEPEEKIKTTEVDAKSNTAEKPVLSSTVKLATSISSSSSTSLDKEKNKKRIEEVEKIDYKELKRQKLEQDPLLKYISLHEIELIDHDKALRGTQKSNDFSNLVRECEYKIVRPLKASLNISSTSTSKSKIASSSSTSSSGATLSAFKSKSKTSASLISNNDATSLSTILRKKDPIIILSPSAISMITMNNVKSFLQDGKFIDPQNNSSTNESSNMIQIIRQSKKFNRKIKFVVVNNVEKFFVKPEYWDRVIAVFTTGQEWQFKNYKINKPNLLFQKVKGFYVNYTGDVVPNNINNWNVEIISLDRNQRFKDRQISEYLWESIERFMFSKGYK